MATPETNDDAQQQLHSETVEPDIPGYNCEQTDIPELDWFDLHRYGSHVLTVADVVPWLRLYVERMGNDQPWRLRSKLVKVYQLQATDEQHAQREAEIVTARQLAHALRMML